MNAKEIGRLRNKMKNYLVQSSWDKFGDFNHRILFSPVKVMARNPKEAVFRYCKKTNIQRNDIQESTKTWGEFKVIPADDLHENFITYWS